MNPNPAIGPREAQSRNHGGRFVLAMAVIVSFTLMHHGPAHAKSAEGFLILNELIPRSDMYEGVQAVSHVRLYSPPRRAQRGNYVVLLPSLGRGVEDFTEQYGSSLTTRLVQAGYQVVLIQPRGIGDSTGDLTPLPNPGAVTLQKLVGDIKEVLDTLGIAEAHFVGHAFGNRLARSFATLYPDYVIDVALLAAGGQNPPAGVQELLFGIFLTDNDQVRLSLVDKGFFAEGNDASVWLNGWASFAAAFAQGLATLFPDVDFKEAGGKPILVVQPREDWIAPPEDAGRLLASELGDQVTYVEIPNTGHALLPERPGTVAARLIAYFASSRSRGD